MSLQAVDTDIESVEFADRGVEVLQALLDQVTEGVVAVDRNGKPIAFNSAAARIMRLELSRTTVTQWAEHSSCYLPDRTTLCPVDQLPIVRAMRGDTVEEAVLFVRYPEEREGFWVSVSARPIRGSDGGLRGAMVVLRDITEIEQARMALKLNEEMFRSLIENTLDAILVLDATGKIRFVSSAIQTSLGYVPEKLIGRSAFDLLHPDDLPRVREIFQAGVERPDAIASEEFRVRHTDGSWRFFAAVGKNLLKHPEVAGIIITVRDVTERIRTEQQGLFHTSLLDHLRSAVIALDTEGRIVYWNNFAWKLYYRTPEEVLGKRLFDVVVPSPNHDQYKEVLLTVREAGYWEGEFPLWRGDGTVFPASATIAAVRDRRGTLIGYVGAAVDITERKEAEEHLRASREQLRHLAARYQSVREAERHRIARDIHDDLGQQLTALKIDLFHIANELSAKAASRKIVSSIKSTMSLVDSTIESVRRISAELRPSVLDDLGLAAAIEWQLQHFQSRTRIRCSFQRPDDNLPLEPDRATGVFWIFQEVLTNVARHANARELRVAIKREDGALMLDVQDNGRGITKKQIADPRSLGLLGMRERALGLGGELSVRGVRGKGTRVSLRVPMGGRQGNGLKQPTGTAGVKRLKPAGRCCASEDPVLLWLSGNSGGGADHRREPGGWRDGGFW